MGRSTTTTASHMLSYSNAFSHRRRSGKTQPPLRVPRMRLRSVQSVRNHIRDSKGLSTGRGQLHQTAAFRTNEGVEFCRCINRLRQLAVVVPSCL